MTRFERESGGFKKLISEDKYTLDDCDFYSLNHLLSDSGFPDISFTGKNVDLIDLNPQPIFGLGLILTRF